MGMYKMKLIKRKPNASKIYKKARFVFEQFGSHGSFYGDTIVIEMSPGDFLNCVISYKSQEGS